MMQDPCLKPQGLGLPGGNVPTEEGKAHDGENSHSLCTGRKLGILMGTRDPDLTLERKSWVKVRCLNSNLGC